MIAFLAVALPARADVDMTGRWHLAVQIGSVTQPWSAMFGQTGTTLAYSTFGDQPRTAAGTIDPGTGAFSVDFGPTIQDGAPTPGPDGILSGTAAPDGRTLTGQLTVCIWDGDWGCGDFHVTGAWTGSFVCGNGDRELGEPCDAADDPDATCCTVGCTLVDPDADAICSAADNCPNDYDPTQADADGDGIGDVCDPSSGGTPSSLQLTSVRLKMPRPGSLGAARLQVRGEFSGALLAPTQIQLEDTGSVDLQVASLAEWTGHVCENRSSRRIDCRSIDRKTLRVTLWTSGTAASTVRFRVALRDPPLGTPVAAPIRFTMLAPDGVRSGTLSSCIPMRNGGVFCAE